MRPVAMGAGCTTLYAVVRWLALLLVATAVARPTSPPTSPMTSSTSAALVPDAVLDLRYATEHNFTGKQLYPAAHCKLRRAVADKLVARGEGAARAGPPARDLGLLPADVDPEGAVEARARRALRREPGEGLGATAAAPRSMSGSSTRTARRRRCRPSSTTSRRPRTAIAR